MIFEINNLNDQILGKKILNFFKNDIEMTPPLSKIMKEDFIVSGYSQKTFDITDKPFGEGNRTGEINYIVFYNQDGLSLYCENQSGNVVEVE